MHKYVNKYNIYYKYIPTFTYICPFFIIPKLTESVMIIGYKEQTFFNTSYFPGS